MTFKFKYLSKSKLYLKIIYGRNQGTRRCFWWKNRSNKSRATVPLNEYKHFLCFQQLEETICQRPKFRQKRMWKLWKELIQVYIESQLWSNLRLLLHADAYEADNVGVAQVCHQLRLPHKILHRLLYCACPTRVCSYRSNGGNKHRLYLYYFLTSFCLLFQDLKN